MKKPPKKPRQIRITRYYVEWHPTDKIQAKCTEKGMQPDDGTALWDWVDVVDYATTHVFPTFEEAVAFALTIVGKDCLGGPRIYQQNQHIAKHGQIHRIEWTDECFWDGVDDKRKPDPTQPDEYCT